MVNVQVGVVVVGHGGIPTDFPLERRLRFRELKRLMRKQPELCAEFERAELELRKWPRTPETDPFWAGFESVVNAMREQLPEALVLAAYNEFCSPTIDQAVAKLASEGCVHIRVLSSMITPGGSHSEHDVPKHLERIRADYPNVQIDYAWPYDVAEIARLFSARVMRGPLNPAS